MVWVEISASSANSARGFVQKAVLPLCSVLADWFTFARARTEGADCYLSGAILPIMGALLERRVWVSLAGKKKYPNIFSIIVGKPRAYASKSEMSSTFSVGNVVGVRFSEFASSSVFGTTERKI